VWTSFTLLMVEIDRDQCQALVNPTVNIQDPFFSYWLCGSIKSEMTLPCFVIHKTVSLFLLLFNLNCSLSH